jgi:hypothetical protein
MVAPAAAQLHRRHLIRVVLIAFVVHFFTVAGATLTAARWAS